MMKNGRLAFYSILGLALIFPLVASSSLHADCDSGSMDIIIAVFDTDLIEGPDFAGIHIYRQTLGLCNEVSLNPDAALPWPALEGQEGVCYFTDATAEEDQGYIYLFRVLDHDGNIVAAPNQGMPNKDFTGCGDWALTRGELSVVWNGDQAVPSIAACECWIPEGLFETLVPTDDWIGLVGQVVEVRGDYIFNGMPGPAEYRMESLVQIESCENPVGTQAISLSNLKARYR